jgi:HEAT repeat protein
VQPATEPPSTGVTAPGEASADHTADVADRRRRVALAGFVGDAATARAALGDGAASVRVTGLGAVERLGILTDADVERALTDPAPEVRRRGCELAATRPAVELAEALRDDDDSVVEMAAWALGERGERAAVAALSELAAMSSGHRDPLCREAAVAALGAIGDRAGLHAVLDALDDKPAIRRRAAVSLAAFDGPEVDAALRRCLEDRDWQVRQVAEDLLALE